MPAALFLSLAVDAVRERGHHAGACPLLPFPRPPPADGEKGGGGGYVWRANPIHPWHKATGVSHMGLHTVVPPATPILLAAGMFALRRHPGWAQGECAVRR